MCGICGFNWEDKTLIKDMCDSISHRGPDQKGFFFDVNLTLGHQRLKIIDLSEKGSQPLFNEDKTICIIFNGEIYNYKELRKSLEAKKHQFNSDTDTESIVHLYEEYGQDCVNRLHGMFAFAIWDSKNKTLFLARDRLGVKPLFYYFDGKKFIFASEIKAIILDKAIKRKLSYTSLNQIINYGYILNDDTLFDGIKELLPGHHLIFKNGKIEIKKYWEIKLTIGNESLDYYAKNLRKLLESAVQKRLMSDVPLGATLSGGIDSSAIVAIMSKLTDNIRTFTIGFEKKNEFKEAKLVADYCNTEHKEIMLNYGDIDKKFEEIVWHYELPFGEPSVLLTYFLAKELKKDITVTLIGDGADELFAGYNRYVSLASNSELAGNQIAEILSNNFNSLEVSQYFSEKLIKNKPENIMDPFSFIKKSSIKDEKLNAALLFELKSIIPNIHLNRVDRMSMAHAVEMRVPFLDHELVEFSMTIPSRFKWHNSNKKLVLQKAVSDLLPKDVAKRKKLPFGMPFSDYYRKNFNSTAKNILLSNEIKKRDYIRHNNFEKIIKKAENQENLDDNLLRRIMFLTSLEVWHRKFID